MDLAFCIFKWLYWFMAGYVLLCLVIRTLNFLAKNQARTKYALKIRYCIVLILLMPLIGHVGRMYFDKYTILYPQNICVQDIIGCWEKGNKKLMFEADGTFEHSHNISFISRNFLSERLMWKLDNSFIVISNEKETRKIQFKIVMFNQRYRILYFDDWDACLSDLGYKKDEVWHGYIIERVLK